MKGYLQNTSARGYFTLQRQIQPGGKVQLEDAFKSIGHQSGLEETQVTEFIEFLQNQVLVKGSWEYFEAEGKPFGAKTPAKKTPAKKATPKKKAASDKGKSPKKANDAKGAGRALRRDINEAQGITVTPAAIIDAPYDQARGLIEKTNDRSVLKKALALTQHFGGKERHMRHLMKRMEQIY